MFTLPDIRLDGDDDRRVDYSASAASKNAWIAAYADLYRQVFGETADARAIVADAAHRMTLVGRNRDGQQVTRDLAKPQPQTIEALRAQMARPLTKA